MSTLVTGATGYIGYHLVKRLIADGERVHVIVRPESNTARLCDFPSPPALHVVDLAQPDAITIMRSLIADIQPAAIFHLAATSGPSNTDQGFNAIIESNLVFSAVLLEAVSSQCSANFVNVGSWSQFDEAGDFCPNGFYGATKQAAHDLMVHYAVNQKMKAATVALFDVYGPYDWRKKLTYFLAQSLDAVQPATPGGQFLDMIFVDDVVSALIRMEQHLSEKQWGEDDTLLYFAGTGRKTSIKDISAIFAGVADKATRMDWGALPYREDTQFSPCLAKPLVPGWTAKVTLEEGLKRVLGVDIKGS